MRNGCGQSGRRTLKLGVSQEWIDAMNWFLACWCKFKKTKSYFNDFWVGQVKNGHGHLVCEMLKSAEWVHGLSWFFACWLWWNKFLLDQHWAFYLWLLAIAGRILWNRVCIVQRRGNKDFKKGCKLDQGVGALKKGGEGGLEPPYKLWSVYPSLLTSLRVFSWNLIMRFLWMLPCC